MKLVSTKATRAASLLVAVSALVLWMTMSLPIGAARVGKATAQSNSKINSGSPKSISIPTPRSPTNNRQENAPHAPLATFTVDRTDDVSPPATGCDDVTPNDCSLRGAVIKANTTGGTDTIAVPAGTYTLTIPGIGEEAAMTGDLDLTETVTLQGAGAGSTIIQAGTTSPVPTPAACVDCIDRVFHVVSSGVTAEFMDLTIRHGSEGNAGGAIFNSGTAKVTNSTLTNNHAGNGGGILNGGTLEVTNSTLSSNFGSSNAGGILNNGVTAKITNSTLSNNFANASGGGIVNSSGGLEINNATLSNNSASNGGGIFNLGNVIFKNSIVANSPSGGNCVNLAGTFTALGKNFDTDGTGAALDPDFMTVTPAQLNLGPLQNNGGPTQTHALQAGSVAIDAVIDCTKVDGATAVTEDQRGVTRPIDGDLNTTVLCDVGAYEAGSPQVFTVDRADDVNPPATGCDDMVANDCSLRGAVINANATAGMHTITVPAGTYTLAIAGGGEEAAMTGDLDLTKSVTLQGAGAASTIIQAGTTVPLPSPSCPDCIDRVFHVVSGGVTAEFKDLTIRHGREGSGGGIFNGGGTVKITNSTVSHNHSNLVSGGNGGAGIRNQGGTVEITNSTVSGNGANLTGGGIYLNGGTLTISNSTLSGNSSGGANGQGGGIFINLNTSTVDITNSNLSANVGKKGGAIHNNTGTVTITDSTLSSNSGEDGGAIHNSGTLTITGSTLSNNTVADDVGTGNGSGGGIFNANPSSSVTITNCTLSNNLADDGGGIFNLGPATINNSTLSNNSAGGATPSGGGIFNSVMLTIKNSIVANSPVGGDCSSPAGTFTALGKNFDSDGTGAALDPDFMQVTPAQLNLGPLQNNGGPTETRALLAGSMAIDAVTDCTLADGATAVTEDQRGVARPIDGDATAGALCDAGAYEAPTPPTEITLVSFTATTDEAGALIEWETGFEADNLGYNIYREQGGNRVRLNPRLVAGSALFVGPGVRLGSGRSYAWTDTGRQSKQSSYWLEEVDLKGHSTWYGPAALQNAATRSKGAEIVQQSLMLGETAIGDQTGSSPVHATAKPTSITEANVQTHAVLASSRAAKIAVNAEGWYRVSRGDLAGAGFNTRVNPRMLQLFVDGRQSPMIVNGEQDGSFDAGDSIEFYGLGVDTPFNDSRSYWLVAGNENGLRVSLTKAEGAAQSSRSFTHTVERRDRTIYFAALRNGEKENFFGAVVAINPVDQQLTLSHLAEAAAGNARVEIVLQGVTLREHRVRVDLNGTTLGEIAFSGQSEGTAEFSAPHSVLREGANTVRLTPLAGPSDVSLVGSIRIGYQHSFRAENDALKLTAAGGQRITIDGFTSKFIRVFDVTEADSPQELLGEIKQRETKYSVTVASAEAGERALLAVAGDRQPNGIALNQPSSLRKGKASYVIITRREFADSLDPLAALRRAQGLSVAIVDIEDIYDEFSFGQKTPFAVRDFLAWAKSNWKKKPRFVLFAGDASYDPKSYLGLTDGDLVPTKLVDTNYLETASDDWLADFDDDGVADLAVGRLPIRTAEEATLLVSKIISYESSSPAQEVLLAADANDGFDFEASNNELASLVPPSLRVTQVSRGRVSSETAKRILLDSIHRGQRLVNYTGHGSANQWRGSLLANADALALRNGHFPMFAMMTCFNGYFHDPALDSLAESLLKAEHGGAIAVWASSGMTAPGSQAAMNRELYRLLFNQSRAITIGEAVKRAKSSINDPDIRRTWILLGDPTMKLR